MPKRRFIYFGEHMKSFEVKEVKEAIQALLLSRLG